ncbi:MAG: Hsp20/alpha crystallin family protein [Balneolaceae bacterium]|nr:Hsp20/alpha crystallin family protein [Balneolaceae bacterium]
MTLMRYTRPRNELANKRFSDIIDEFFNDAVSTNQDSFVPSIDISETEDQFLISAELPGMKKEDINISLENGRLSISGERSLKNEEEGKTFHRVETQYGSFSRSFRLPDYVDEETINASYNDGLLNISINKAENKVKKQIKVK